VAKKNSIFLGQPQYVALLTKLYRMIKAKQPFEKGFTEDGAPYCTWGLCTVEKSVWSNKMLHDPVAYAERGELITKIRRPSQVCPFQIIGDDEIDHVGCFTQCPLFQEDLFDPSYLDRDFVIKLYEKAIDNL